MRVISVADMWPDVLPVSLTWSHATNSWSALEAAISKDMIEADISLNSDGVPIMAHPPATESDLTLYGFMRFICEAINKGSKLGIKLDFKCIKAVQPSLNIIRNMELTCPLWLNADIVPGPNLTPELRETVDRKEFLQCCKDMKGAVLSLGFTIGDVERGAEYTDEQFQELRGALQQAKVESQITLALCASIALQSIYRIVKFIDSYCNEEGGRSMTMTLWENRDMDGWELERLRQLVDVVGRHRVYLDVPFEFDLDG